MVVGEFCDVTAAPPVAAESPAGRMRYPCTRAQQRFWILDRLDPANPALNVAVRWRLEGEVIATALDQAWQTVAARHDVLRTFFADDAGGPVQVVEPQIDFRIVTVDLTKLAPAEATAEAERLAAVEARRPFNLTVGPLIRVTRLWLAQRESMLLVTAHHIICDGWSVGLLAAEMGQAYAALAAGRPPALPELPIQYWEYALWQGQVLADTKAGPALAFWERTLSGLKHFELLPDRPRPPIQTSNGDIVSVLLDRGLTAALTDLSRRSGCSLFMTALAALFVLLHRHTGEDDIALGTQVAGRDDVELESLIGLFINTIVLRGDVGGDPSFIALLERVRATVTEAFEYRSIPTETLIEIVQPDRDRSRNAMFSVNFIFQRSFIANATYGDIRLVDMPSRSAGALYDLNFFMVERPDGWRASCEFNTDLFDRATVVAMLRRFEVLLRGAAADPTQRISCLPVLTEDERRRVITEWNRTEAAYPCDATVAELFIAQARRTPDAVAIVCDETTLTYRDLDLATEQMAGDLVVRGHAPGKRVGVCLGRSADLVVTLLAILRAGGTYVPLDPTHPAERLRHVVADAVLTAIVAATELAEVLGASGVPMVQPHGNGGNTPVNAPAADIAYVIYTSGSTGQPKGVAVRQRSLVNLLWAMRHRPGLTADDTLVAVTTVAFDIAALEIFLPLITGARLVIAREQEAADGRALARLLRRHRATVLQATPVTWQLLLDAGWQGDPRLKMLCGGEALPRPLATALLATGGALWNMYGPTETTVWSAVAPVEQGNGPVPIGPPIANTQFYVLDKYGNLAPPGAPGELYIGGDGVAAGYFNRPELTRERFIADPFGGAEDARLYRTGDLVRQRTNGSIEFLGRTDHQIKLRGFRIELGEIEAALLGQPGIAEAVAVAGRDAIGDPTVVAYTAGRWPAAERDAVATELRRRLADALPSYMVPAAIVALDALPRLPNGKIDRRSLPAPQVRSAESASGAQPLDQVEEKLAAIWRSLLGVDAVGLHSDFFELGGNSLLAARLLARVDAEFERRVSLATLFQASTLQQFAQAVREQQAWEFEFEQVVKLQPNGARPTLIALSNTGILHPLSRRLGPDQPFTALQLFDRTALRQPRTDSFEAIAAEYVELIRRVEPRGPYALLGWCVAGSLAYEVGRQLEASGSEVFLVVIVDAWVPGYLRRVSALRRVLADQCYRWQTIFGDVVSVLTGRRKLHSFLVRRNLFNRWAARLGQPRADEAEAPGEAGVLEGERYHEWILALLRRAADRYEPPPYSGRVLLFRAADEPSGLFLDPTLGWRRFATGRFDTIVLDGDHTTIFQDPGVTQMARHITAAVDEFINAGAVPAGRERTADVADAVPGAAGGWVTAAVVAGGS
jgi:amino acid adenylation domain-containing protein